MPPKAKFTREEIIKAAFDMTRTEGIEAVTARALGTKLGSSARPIFSVFESMDEVQKEVLAAAKKLYSEYIHDGLHQKELPAFQGVGVQYIRFAIEEPKLFQLLFMSKRPEKPGVTHILPMIDENYPQILSSVKNCYGFDGEQAERLYRHLWIYSHGIAVLCATNMCSFTPTEIGRMLTEMGSAIIKEFKGETKHD